MALGYECPLFIPVEDAATSLGLARVGECQLETGNRPFNAGAGASVLATGIQSLVWVLRRLRQSYPEARATTRWREFRENAVKLLIWEAFVSGSEKAYPPSHEGDAKLAMEAFEMIIDSDESPTRMPQVNVMSLAAMAILCTGLSDQLELLREPCVVIRPRFDSGEAVSRLAAYNERLANKRDLKRRNI